MAVIDVANTIVKVAADTAGVPGSFATIADLTDYTADHGSEEPTTVRVFGGSPHVRTGALTDDYSLGGLYNPADTNGQNVLKNARDNGVSCWLQVLPNGTAGYQQKIKVTRYEDSAEADGDYVRVAFDAVRDGAATVVPPEES